MQTKYFNINKGLLLEAIRYFIGACGAVFTDWCVWLFLWKGLMVDPEFSQAISRTLGGVVGFFLYKNYSFKEKNSETGNQAAKFLAVIVFSWLLSLSVYSFLIEVFPPFPAKLTSDGITFTVNYFILKFWVFKKNQNQNKVINS